MNMHNHAYYIVVTHSTLTVDGILKYLHILAYTCNTVLLQKRLNTRTNHLIFIMLSCFCQPFHVHYVFKSNRLKLL